MKLLDTEQKNSEWIEKSTLYKEFLKEREEILRYKWLESEKAGEDIGFEAALIGWVRHHRALWKAARKVFPNQQRVISA